LWRCHLSKGVRRGGASLFPAPDQGRQVWTSGAAALIWVLHTHTHTLTLTHTHTHTHTLTHTKTHHTHTHTHTHRLNVMFRSFQQRLYEDSQEKGQELRLAQFHCNIQTKRRQMDGSVCSSLLSYHCRNVQSNSGKWHQI